MSKRKFAEGKPFSNGTEYEVFLDNWCHECTYYKERFDGFPEFPEWGGCPVLDAMEHARFDLDCFPKKFIIEEHDADGNVLCWHKCIRFKRRKTDD